MKCCALRILLGPKQPMSRRPTPAAAKAAEAATDAVAATAAAAAAAASGNSAASFQHFVKSRNTGFVGVSATNPVLRSDHYVTETSEHRLLVGTAQTTDGQVQLATTKRAVKAARREVRDIYDLRSELAIEYEEDQLRRIRKEFEKLLHHIRHICNEVRRNRRERRRRPNFEHLRHQLLQEYGRAIMQLQPRHFRTATIDELVEMIVTGSLMKVNSSHLVNCGVQLLLDKIRDLSPNQLATVIRSVVDIRDGGVSDEQKTRLVVAFFGEVLRYPQRMLRDMSVKNAILLINLGQRGEVGRGIIPDGMSREFLHQLLVTYGASIQEPAPPAEGDNDDGKKSNKKSKRSSAKNALLKWSASDVAVVCSAVVHHRMATEDAVNFFVVSAPLCTEYAYILSPSEISLILLAFGVVRYHDVTLFLTLGQRAGDLGEEMSEDDVGRVIRAFEMTDIGFDSLRNSLESAMRMKNVSRSPLSHH